MNITRKALIKISSDFAYTVSAVVILNIVQQVIIQPYINKMYGPVFLGDILYYLGLTYVFSQMFGTVLGHQRILHKHDDVSEGDFLVLLLLYGLVVFFIGFLDAFFKTNNILFSLSIGSFMIICLIRYYGQVEYRLNLWFKGYLIYFIIISVGYLVGLAIFSVLHIWLVIFFVGEVAAIVYVWKNGHVLRFEKTTGAISKLWIPTTLLIISYLFSSTTYLDRVIIQPMLGSEAVTRFYAISFVGKVINMLLQPVATLLLSYLADRNTSSIDLRFFIKIVLYGIPICFVMIVCSCLATPLAVHVFYPNMIDSVRELNIPINVGNVVSFAGGLMLTFLLAEASINYQLVIRGICFLVYLITTVELTSTSGLLGYAYAMVISNLFLLVLAIICSIHLYKKKKNEV